MNILKNLANLSVKNNIVDIDDVEVYLYGLEVLIYNSSIVVLVLLIGWYMKNLDLTLIYILVFCGLKTLTGGYHSKTRIGCFVFSLVTYLLVMFATISSVNIKNQYIALIGLLFSLIVIYLNSPIVNKNNPKSKNEVIKANAKGQTVTLIVVAISAILFYMGIYTNYFLVTSYSLVAVAINILLAKMEVLK